MVTLFGRQLGGEMNRSLLRSFAGSAFLIVCVATQAIVYRHDRTDAQMLAFGAESQFLGVGQLWVGGGFGTGTFIGYGNGSAWLLTAKHVIDTGDTGTFAFANGDSFAVTDAFGLAGVDISVAKISGWTLNVFAPTLNMDPITGGTFVRSAGYGGSGRAGTQPPGGWVYDDQRRGMETKIAGLYPSGEIHDIFDSPTSPDVTNMEGFGAPGDSGSALVTSAGVALGVLTGGQFEAYGNSNWYATLTAEQSRIIYAHTGIDPNPVPEPASMVALSLGALAVLRRRKRAST